MTGMNHNLQMSESEENGPPWPISVELQKLHGIVIHYSVEVQEAATRLEANRPHVSYHALANLHMRAILLHRSIRDLCEAGWTPVTGVLIRTLLDIYVNCLAIAIVPVSYTHLCDQRRWTCVGGCPNPCLREGSIVGRHLTGLVHRTRSTPARGASNTAAFRTELGRVLGLGIMDASHVARAYSCLFASFARDHGCIE